MSMKRARRMPNGNVAEAKAAEANVAEAKTTHSSGMREEAKDTEPYSYSDSDSEETATEANAEENATAIDSNANESDEEIVVSLDFQFIRKQRQTQNIQNIIKCILSGKYENITPFINPTELQRILEETKLDTKGLFDACRENKILRIVLAGRISKNSTRQGSKDEQLQIDVCHAFAAKHGFSIENLNSTAYRPTKDGRILSAQEVKSQNIPKHMCLKSFDAKMSGSIVGWLFAKVVFGSGGHQDNVFEEADTLCDWVVQFGVEGHTYVILIDTDLHAKMDALKRKYSGQKNLFIGNHVEFQCEPRFKALGKDSIREVRP